MILRVIGFADASFANNHDIWTHLGHIWFLSDCYGNSVSMYFKPYKSKRIVRSAIVGEVIASSDLFDVAVTLLAELGYIFGRKIPIQLCTDS